MPAVAKHLYEVGAEQWHPDGQANEVVCRPPRHEPRGEEVAALILKRAQRPSERLSSPVP